MTVNWRNVINTKNKATKRQRSTWIASMVACFLFLLMAIKVYQVPINNMVGNLLTSMLVLVAIIGLAAIFGRLIVELRKRNK